MKKIAIFTEGQTEQLLIEKIIKEAAGARDISITKMKASGRSNSSRSFKVITAESKDTQYFVLMVDCSSDSKVKSDILDEYSKLSAAGYQKIIGIRDVYPDVSYAETSKLRAGLNVGLPEGIPKVSFILGVMEIEAWLLAEHNHFSKIHEKITVNRIKETLGINLINDDLEQRKKPSEDLYNIYWLESIHYDKSKKKIMDKILSVLDLSYLKNVVSQKFYDLQTLYQEVDLFFSNK